MARSRNIKPGFFENDELAACAPLARLLFIGLWTIADCRGVVERRPRKIKAQVLPYDDCDVNALLSELIEHGFVVEFVANGEPFLHVPKFSQHQNPHQNEKPKFPAPNLPDACTVLEPDKHRTNPADSLNLKPDPRLLTTEKPSTDSGSSLLGLEFGFCWDDIKEDAEKFRRVSKQSKVAVPTDLVLRTVCLGRLLRNGFAMDVADAFRNTEIRNPKRYIAGAMRKACEEHSISLEQVTKMIDAKLKE